LRSILPIAHRNNLIREEKLILNAVALAYTLKADYEKALDFNFQSLVIREREGNKSDISIALNNIGLVYFKLKNYDKALEYYERSLKYKKEANDTYDLDGLLINMGISNIHLKQPEKAKKYIEEGLQLCGNDCTTEIGINGQFGLGVANYYLEDYSEAERHFKKSLEISRQTGNKRFQAENLVYLGRVAVKHNDLKKAKVLLKEAETLADSSGYNQLLIDSYKEFSKLYSLSKEYEKASEYQNKYIHLKDSLIGEELVRDIAKIQTNFEERENLNTIKLREEDLVRVRNLNIAIGVIALLAGLLVFVLYRSNAITRKVNSALSDAKGIIETQNHRLQNINRELDAKVKEKTADLVKANEDLDKANKSLVRVNDELDNFIYKTSHDIRGPLASLKGICSVALMDVKDPLALDYLTKLDISSGRLNVILTRLLIVNQINHAIVGREPIDFNGIVDDVLLLERKKGLPPRFEVRKEIEKNINFHSDKDLVRIILENLIDNSIKFYNDSDRIQPFVYIKIALQHDKDVVVSVIDNGIGIAEAKPDKIFQMFSRASERSGTGGIGLYLSKLASEKLGGQINLRNTPEGYTEFYVSFPLKMQLV
jgi:signal transduction histidine kinase